MDPDKAPPPPPEDEKKEPKKGVLRDYIESFDQRTLADTARCTSRHACLSCHLSISIRSIAAFAAHGLQFELASDMMLALWQSWSSVCGFFPMCRLVSVEGQALVETQSTALFGDVKQLTRQMQEAVGTDVSSLEEVMQRVQQAVEQEKVGGTLVASFTGDMQ